MSDEKPPLIDEGQAAFLQRGLSMTAGSTGGGEFPHLCRVLGCRLSANRRRISILLSRRQGADLLADVALNARIAVVFSEPSTHRTIQIKGSDATVLPASVEDAALARRHREAFVAEVQVLGFRADMAGALHICPDDELAAIAFTVEAAFSQTPGPRAGDSLRAGA